MKKQIIASLLAAVVFAAPMTVFADNKIENANVSNTKNDAVICIGSVSKMFSTTAVMQLAEQGKVDIDAPITEYLPDFRMADERYKDITVRMLMNHTSGLMGTTGGDFMLYEDRDSQTHDTLLDELCTQRLKADPGDFGAYCNDGFTLLELITEEVSGMSFTEYIDKYICQPLGMEQTGTPWTVFETENQPDIFVNNNVRYATDYCMAIGSGGIMSTSEELCKFGSSFFKGNETILSEKSKQEMAKTDVTDKYEDGFGLGWDQVEFEEYKAADVKVVSKGGDLNHQHAELLVAPDEEISVSVLSAGGSSTANLGLAKALMDIALEEKGINIQHSEAAEKETVEKVPDKYMSYEGIYISAENACIVTFPQQKYMEIRNLFSDKPVIQQYMYTTDDDFVLMDGNIEEGKAVQNKNEQSVLSFRNRDGIDYICNDVYYKMGNTEGMNYSSYYLQRVEKNDISQDVKAVWDARNGKKYYLADGKYSNTNYYNMPVQKLYISDEAEGYTSFGKIIDKNNAVSALKMPGGRDIYDVEFKIIDGIEYADISNYDMTFISEDAIPDLKNDITEVKLNTKQAKWYNINNSDNKTIQLDIPENAAVYVYDEYDRVTYSNYMKDYGNSVPLPSKGKIVFLGEDGGVVGITQ